MALIPRRLNMLLWPAPGGGCSIAAVEDFSLAFGSLLPQATLDGLLARRDGIEQSLIGNESRPTSDELALYGKEIAQALFSGGAQTLYSVLGQETIEVTVAAGDHNTRRVPWEYVVWPDKKHAPLADRSVARVVSVNNVARHQPRPLKSAKLKVLLIGADVVGGDPIPWDETKALLDLVFGKRINDPDNPLAVDLTIVEGATREQFNNAVLKRPYDIIHFIGHGQADGLFLARKGEADGELVPQAALNTIMSQANPGLLFLSACNTGAALTGFAFDSLAESLVHTGIPAVVAHQMPINLRAIGEFAAAVYESLLAEGNIDKAVNQGRMRLVAQLGDAQSAAVEWGIPVLYRRPGCSQMFVRGA